MTESIGKSILSEAATWLRREVEGCGLAVQSNSKAVDSIPAVIKL
jgi:hypothetical protein